jgi:serine phosphatase RsbU (regulator of sigma subunit)
VSRYKESEAFYRATLVSEQFRIAGLLGVLGALMVYTFVRGIWVGGFRLLWIQSAVIALVIAHEIHVWFVVKKALQQQEEVPTAIWLVNVLVESQLPTLALCLLLASEWMSPYQVLVAPAVLIYFLFIILSALRLSPSLTVLTGLLSALGYLCVTFYIEENFQSSRSAFGAFPLSIYFIYAGLILIAGIIGGVVAQQIGGYVEAALREADLENELKAINHDLEIARSIQQGLLPVQSPKLNDFEIAGWNQPADQTGGDYFDWQELPEGRIAISLGDATGHGIGPALVSASCRAYARASFLVGGTQNGVLDRLNGLLTDDLPTNRFVTFAVVFFDPATSHVKVLSAGHGPILLYRYDTDKIEHLEAQGIPLGMISGTKYSHGVESYLRSGDLLALITDGFFEWQNPAGEEFGLRRLDEVIQGSRDLSAEEVITSLRQAVARFCEGSAQMDDLTVVVLKRKTGPSTP